LFALWCGFLAFCVYQVSWWVWIILLGIGAVAAFRLERIQLVDGVHAARAQAVAP
jgi:hypothetical protein